MSATKQNLDFNNLKIKFQHLKRSITELKEAIY